MALASQSSRPDRPFASSRRSPSLLGGRGVIVAVAAAASLGGAFWLMRNDAQSSSGTGADASLGAVVQASPLAPASARSSALELALSDAANNARAETHRENVARASAELSAPTEDAQAAALRQPDSPTSPTNAQTAPSSTSPTSLPPSMPQNTTPPVGNGFDGNAPAGTGGAATPSQPAGFSFSDALALAATNPIEARTSLSQALLSGTLGPIESKQAADALVKIGSDLFFTPNFNANDRFFFQYAVQSGDTLEKIVRKHKIGCDWRLVARINNIKKPEAIRVGQRLKLPKGPFSAVVSKRDYRVDLCMGTGSDRVVFTSLPCGLGKSNGTPVGRFKVRPGSKLLNPEWRNPITGEFFDANDPANPIGEHWLGLEGIEPSNAGLLGYGMHGTIEPASIGQDQSLGCVRLIAEDIAIVWETLADGCEVEIRP